MRFNVCRARLQLRCAISSCFGFKSSATASGCPSHAYKLVGTRACVEVATLKRKRMSVNAAQRTATAPATARCRHAS